MRKKKKFKLNTFDTLNTIFMILLLIIIIYPLWYVIIASFSEANAVAAGKVKLWPVDFTTVAYDAVMKNKRIWTGYANSIFYTFFGTLANLFMTIPIAYTLSKKELPHRGAITTFLLVSMYIGGSMIPTYLIVKSLGLLNTRFVLILLSGYSVYNIVVTRTFFSSSIDGALYEAGDLDGASEWQKFTKIAFPLSKPILAVMALYYGVGQWNSYSGALLYIRDPEKEPLQLVLRRILVLNERAMTEQLLSNYLSDQERLDLVKMQNLNYTMKYAVVFIAAAPLLIAYPFVQKHFTKGLMVGSVKG